jgi:hypothetical protein
MMELEQLLSYCGANGRSSDVARGDPALRVIAHELVSSTKSNLSVDWIHREAARARSRVLVKRLLRKMRLPTRLAGRGHAEGPTTGWGVIAGLGGVIAVLQSRLMHGGSPSKMVLSGFIGACDHPSSCTIGRASGILDFGPKGQSQ